jgi:rhodanese-related sulfurtransferase
MFTSQSRALHLLAVLLTLFVSPAARAAAPCHHEAGVPDIARATGGASNAIALSAQTEEAHRRGMVDVNVEIPGVRRLRPVLGGLVYRGAAMGSTALSASAVTELCKAGFSRVIYFYKTPLPMNDVSCTTSKGKPNSLHYEILSNITDRAKIMGIIRDTANDPSKGPILVHCWNGWHATGEISAMAKMQFCKGWDGKRGSDDWVANIDGSSSAPYIGMWGPGGPIQSYKPIPGIELPADVQLATCPK